MKLVKLLLVIVSFLVVGKSLVVNNLITYVGVTVVLAEWDSHGRHLVLSHLALELLTFLLAIDELIFDMSDLNSSGLYEPGPTNSLWMSPYTK